ncbi:MAG: relaxase domain-containing protein [Candidatus Microthrix sp.]|nr:relaxase domain-containing protein [Candidatus Microthrix sp.]
MERAHQSAVNDALNYLRDQAILTREGAQGIRQVETRGLIGTAFTHRDSRASDPDLHRTSPWPTRSRPRARTSGWPSTEGPLQGHRDRLRGLQHPPGASPAACPRRPLRGPAGTDPRKRPIREILGVDPS